MRATSYSAAIAASLLSTTSASPLASRQNSTMIYDFSELTPSADLEWRPCYNNFTCTLLEVPLDYTNTSIGTTNIAFIKYSSGNSSAEDILINPGGPGGSGVVTVLTALSVFTEKVGSSYNIVGFDPRGVNNSGPSLSCFGTSSEGSIEANIFYDKTFVAVDNSSQYLLEQGFRRSGAYGDWCSPVLSVNGTAQYAGTVAVANDMLHYVELAAKAKGCKPEEAKLWYYGISYGTVIGATFASLFPERIGRMIIDGVVDSEDYYAGQWSTAVYDTDSAAHSFFAYCFEAGPELCAFHKNASSPEEIEQRYINIYNALKKSPIDVAVPALTIPPVEVTWQDLSADFFSLLYFPDNFPLLAVGLSELENGNATLIALADPEAAYLVPNTYNDNTGRGQIACLDAAGRFNLSTFEKYEAYINEMNERSFYGGPAVASIIAPICRNFDIFPPESQLFNGKPGANSTSAPILLIGNTRDPITPLRSAKKMSSLFAGSEVLTLNTTGHSSYGQLSNCVNNYTQAYMTGGTLPPPDTVCELDTLPFMTAGTGSAKFLKRRRL